MILLDGRSLSLEQLLAIADDRAEVALAPGAVARVSAARAVVDAKAAGDAAVYGINTGFGSFAEVKIPRESLERLQLNLLRSHASGVGEPLPVRAVRAMMALRANVLARGFSGIRLETLEALLARSTAACIRACRAADRSARAATSLRSPTSRWCSSAKAQTWDGAVERPGAEALARRRPRAGPPRAKGGPGAHQRHAGLHRGPRAGARRRGAPGARRRRRGRALDRRPARLARPFDPRIHAERPHRRPGGVGREHRARCSTAARSTRRTSTAARVQDAYSERCAAQVHGSAREALRFVRRLTYRRGERRHRQPDGVRRARARSSRAATSTARRSRWPPTCWRSPSRSWPRSASGAPSAWSTRRSATCPPFLTREGGLQSGLHAGAGHRRRAHVGAEGPRAPGERGHDSDVGEQGRSRQHEHGRRAEGRARARARALRALGRTAVRAARRSTSSRRSTPPRRSRACTPPSAPLVPTARRRPPAGARSRSGRALIADGASKQRAASLSSRRP